MHLVWAHACRMEAAEHGMARLTAQLESGHTEQQAQKREVRILIAAKAVPNRSSCMCADAAAYESPAHVRYMPTQKPAVAACPASAFDSCSALHMLTHSRRTT
jgi:hypothetical protein